MTPTTSMRTRLPARDPALIQLGVRSDRWDFTVALAGNPNIEIHTYPGRSHAFARRGGQHFEPEAATLANNRTIAFLREHLST